MATDFASTFIGLLGNTQLLEPSQLQELSHTPSDTDPAVLAQCLIDLGWLTHYQLDLVTQGKAQELRIGSYLVLDKAGLGPLGTAYKVRRPGKSGVFMLKLISKEKFGDPDQLTRFQHDIRIAAQLQHPHIAALATVGQVNNQFIFVRDYVEGDDLAEIVRETGPLAIGRACTYVRQAALALQYAHDKGLVHRRVKPANLIGIKAGSNGQGPAVKVVDFGLANLKPRSSADPGDRDGDLRGLGRTLCYLLTGRAPAPPDASWQTPPGAGPLSTLRSGIPLAVQSIAVKLLAAGSATGCRSMAEAVAALEPHAHEPVVAAPAPASSNGTTEVIAPAMPSEFAPIPVATAAIWAVPVTTELVPEPADVPVATALVQAVSVDESPSTTELPAVPMCLPSFAEAHPGLELGAAGLSVSATAAEGAEVAMCGVVTPCAEPVATAAIPADAQVATAPIEASNQVDEAAVPMAAAVTVAVSMALVAEEPPAVEATSLAPPAEPASLPEPIHAPLTESLPASVPPVANETPAADPLPFEPSLLQAAAPPALEIAPLIDAPLEPRMEPAVLAAPPEQGLVMAQPLDSAFPPPVIEAAATLASPEPIATMPSALAPAAATTWQAPASPFDAPGLAFGEAPLPQDGDFSPRSAPPRKKGRKKLSRGAVIGLSVGALLHVVFVGLIIWVLVKMNGPETEEPPKTKPAPRVVPKNRSGPVPTAYPMEINPKKPPTVRDGDVDPLDR